MESEEGYGGEGRIDLKDERRELDSMEIAPKSDVTWSRYTAQRAKPNAMSRSRYATSLDNARVSGDASGKGHLAIKAHAVKPGHHGHVEREDVSQRDPDVHHGRQVNRVRWQCIRHSVYVLRLKHAMANVDQAAVRRLEFKNGLSDSL